MDKARLKMTKQNTISSSLYVYNINYDYNISFKINITIELTGF